MNSIKQQKSLKNRKHPRNLNAINNLENKIENKIEKEKTNSQNIDQETIEFYQKAQQIKVKFLASKIEAEKNFLNRILVLQKKITESIDKKPSIFDFGINLSLIHQQWDKNLIQNQKDPKTDQKINVLVQDNKLVYNQLVIRKGDCIRLQIDQNTIILGILTELRPFDFFVRSSERTLRILLSQIKNGEFRIV
ncbi:hypothetical protein M0811_07215 [Anaeramoeba ignava]|uniref:Uncharacterized protein n=1 Tax=Anaeramoeba ignava TaxID=1746090 RepID=A0A9Q0LPQ4_ANAIG|nr:hypothetical protein M0811_07215 [Anaeramoeba ignava]